MKTNLWTIFLMVLALTSGQSMAENGKISITAGYRERIALPSDAVLEVELLDVSRADAPSIRLSSQLFTMDRVPLSVDLHYDPSIIDDRMTYSVAARVLSGGRVMFRTTSAYPVITREAPTRVDVVLQMMPQENHEQVSDQRIAGVPWALSQLGGRAFVGDDNPTIVFDTDGTFSLFGGCNRFHGKAELGEDRLTFPQQFAGTKMVCPAPRMRLERDVLEALAATVRFHRNGRSLAFANESGLTTARFEERPD